MAGIAFLSLGLVSTVIGLFLLLYKSKPNVLVDSIPVKKEIKIVESAANLPAGSQNKDLARNTPAGHSQKQNIPVAAVLDNSIQEKESTTSFKDAAKSKGDAFEKYVVQKFDKKYFTLKEWTSDKFVDGIYAENTLNPDLVYQLSFKDVSEGLAVECKWRSKLNNAYKIVTEQQIKNYKNFEKEKNIPVFLVLGVGGEPSSPEQLYIIPLNRINSGNLNISFLEEFKQEVNRNFFFDHKTKILTAKSFVKTKVEA